MSAILKPAADDVYARLCAQPPGQTGEIINGRLYVQPRPGGPHAIATSVLGGELNGRFQRGRGGPGGWWIVDEPELHFIRDVAVCVPDIAGWRRARLPKIPRGHRFELAPDWICEVLSPGTARLDRTEKMPLYARFDVAHLWLVHPLERTLEAYALHEGRWMVVGLFKDNDLVEVEPFVELALPLGDLWAELEDDPASQD